MNFKKMIKKLLKPKTLVVIGLALLIIHALFSPMRTLNTLEGFEEKKIIHLIHMNKCPYCEKMMPAWKEFKKSNKSNVIVNEVERSEDPAFVKKHGVTSFPTIIMTSGGKKIADYEGDRSAQSFLDFAKNHA